MTKNDLIKTVAGKVEMTQKDVSKVVDSLIETIVEAVASGEKIQFVGFGSFEVAERAARTGRNPQTGEAIEIPASKTPKFKAGKAFKDAVNA